MLLKIFLFTLLSLNLRAFGACENMTFSIYPSSVNLNTNNFQQLDVEVNKNGGTCDNFYIAIDNGNSNSSLTRTLQSGSNFYPVQFYKDSSSQQILKSEFEASANDVITGSFNGSLNQVRAAFYINMNLNDNRAILAFGNYSQNFTLKLFEGSFGSGVLRDQKVIHVSFVQNRVTELSLVTTGSNFTKSSLSQSLDFGPLSEGATRGFDIVMIHNAGYAVSLSSLNSGKLKHESKNIYVTYTFTIEGVPMNISNTPHIIKSGYGLSTPNGTRLPVLVKIGDVSKASAGTYTDIITISVDSTE